MASASLTIAISGSYNGSAITRAENALNNLNVKVAAVSGGVAEELAKAGASAAEFGGNLYNIGSKMESVGTAATKYITVPILAAAAACGSAAIDIDSALTSVKKTVDGTEQEYEQLKDAAIAYSETNAVSADEILEIEALGAQLGFATDELEEFGSVVSGLDIATDMDAETAATEMAQFANITGMAHDEVSNYASAIVDLGNNYATTESDISSMAQRLAAAGTQVGMSEADILGLATALTSMGLEAEAGGTAFSTIMSEIDKAVATSSDSLETWASAAGMSAQEFSEAWSNDPVSALSAVISGLDAATDEGSNMSVMLEELGISSIRQTDAMKRLANNSEFLADAVDTANEAWEDNTALQTEVDNRNESMASQLEILKNKVTAVAYEVGEPLVNAALDFVDCLDPIIEGVKEAAENFSDMDEEDQKNVVTLIALAAAAGPVVTVAGKLVKGVGNVVTAFGKFEQKAAASIVQSQSLQNELLNATSSMKVSAAGAESLGEATTQASKGSALLETGMKAINTACKACAIGLVVALVADLVSQFQSYCEHEELVEDATTGLTDAIGSAQAAYEAYSPSVDTASDSLDNAASSAEDCLEAQAELASTISDTWSGIGTDAAMVDYYTGRIEELANKSDLTEAEQAELKAAVEGFNDVTGASIEVVDAQNGALSESVDAIKAVGDAYADTARIQAAQEVYAQVTEQLIQDEASLEEATEALNEADEGWGIWLGDFPVIADENSVKYHELQQNVSDLQAAVDSAKDTQSQMMSVMAGSGASFATFDAALEASGTSMSEFGDLTEDELATLQSSFDGTLASIVTACEQNGIQIPQTLADAINSNSSTATSAAQTLGNNVTSGLATGITDSQGEAEDSTNEVAEAIQNSFKIKMGINSPSTVMKELGGYVVEGLTNGIDGSSNKPVSAMSTIGKNILSAVSNLPSLLTSTGSNSGSGLASGLSSKSGSVSSSASGLSSTAKSGVNPVVSAFSSIGSSAASTFANVIGNSSASSQGRSLANTANSGLSSVSAKSAGSNFIAGFKSGMSSMGSSLASVARSLANSALSAIKRTLGIASPSKEAMEVGDYFGQGLVLGMESTEDEIAKEAASLGAKMEVSPSAYSSGSYSGGYQTQQRNMEFNVTVNVNANTEQQAASIGRNIGSELYLEYKRRERAYA